MRGVQIAAWCRGWSVLGDGRGEERSLVFLPVMPVSPCAPSHPFGAVLAHLVCKICHFCAPRGATALRGKAVTEVNGKLNVPSAELKAARFEVEKIKAIKNRKEPSNLQPKFSSFLPGDRGLQGGCVMCGRCCLLAGQAAQASSDEPGASSPGPGSLGHSVSTAVSHRRFIQPQVNA